MDKSIFEFEKQFLSPDEYYKSQLVLRLLNDKIRISDILEEYEDLDVVVNFCNQHGLLIAGFIIKEFVNKSGQGHWKNIDLVKNPGNGKANSWVFENSLLEVYKMSEHEIHPVLRVDHSLVQRVLQIGADKLQLIKEFDFLLYSELVYMLQDKIEDELPDGVCLNCKSTDLAMGDVQCMDCQGTLLLFFDEAFPAEDGLVEQVQKYLNEILS